MDIKLNDNRLEFEDGDLKLVSGLDEIKQHIVVALNTMFGDWLLDWEKGIDYARGFRYPEFMANDVRKQIAGVNGVVKLQKLKMTFDRANFGINISAVVVTTMGNIEINEGLKNVY